MGSGNVSPSSSFQLQKGLYPSIKAKPQTKSKADIQIIIFLYLLSPIFPQADCTAKAISHRLAKLKTIASDAPIRTTPKRAPRGTKSGGETGSAAKKRKIHKEEKEEQEEKKEIEEDEPDSPSVAAGKKLMQALLDNATEVNYDPMRWF